MRRQYSKKAGKQDEENRTNGNRRKSGSDVKGASKKQRMKEMCCGLWLAKRDGAAGGSRKIADKGTRIKAEDGERGGRYRAGRKCK